MMRLTIRAKILGILAFLLLAMAAVAAFSAYRVAGVTRELHLVAGSYLKILRCIEQMRAHALEQELNFARLVRFYELGSAPRALVEREEKAFRTRSDQVDSEIATCRQLLETAGTLRVNSVDHAELKQLTTEVTRIQKEHKELESHFAETLRALRTNVNTGRLLEAVVEQEENDFDRALDSVRTHVESFISRSATLASRHADEVLTVSIASTALAVLLGVALSVIFANGIVGPIRRLVSGTQEIASGNLEIALPRTTRDEIGDLTRSFNTMALGLRDRERIKQTFGRYIDPRIVEKLLDNQADTGLGTRETMAVFFSDVAGFTSISEKLTPPALVSLMNRYLTVMSERVRSRDGVIDKFVGDAIMAFWGPPFVAAEQRSQLACESALDQVAELDGFNSQLGEALGIRSVLDPIDLRIGIHTGEVVAGNIGSETARNFTIMGDTVNLASRLEGANKQYGSRILISEAAWAETTGLVARELDLIQVKGKEEPVRVFELLGRQGALSEETLRWVKAFEQGLVLYRQRRWEDADQAFRHSQELRPGDQAARLFVARSAYFRDNPPEAGWTGVWKMKTK